MDNTLNLSKLYIRTIETLEFSKERNYLYSVCKLAEDVPGIFQLTKSPRETGPQMVYSQETKLKAWSLEQILKLHLFLRLATHRVARFSK